MKAMILAAGLGKRLQPLTNDRPKALVKIKNKTLLQIIIDRLQNSGFNEIIVNIHHFSDMIIDFLKTHNFPNCKISISDERKLLLDTGGELKKARWFFDDDQPFLVHNVDVISDLDLKKMYDIHINSDNLATLAIRSRETQRYLLFDSEKKLQGWENTKTKERIVSNSAQKILYPYGFSGIHILSPDIFNLMPLETVFSITKMYIDLADQHRIFGYDHSDSIWVDVGKPHNLEMAAQYIS